MKQRRIAGKLILCLGMLVLLAALVLTKSRTSWVSLMVGSALFSILLMAGVRIRAKHLWFGTSLLGGVLVLFYFSGASEMIFDRFAVMKNGQDWNLYSITYRFTVWMDSLSAMAHRPSGWGLGTFVHIFPQFKSISDRFIVDYAHNEIFHNLVELGLFTVLLLGGALVTFLKHTHYTIIKGNTEKADRPLAIALFCALVSLFLCSTFDFPLRIYANAIIMMILLGLYSAVAKPPVAIAGAKTRAETIWAIASRCRGIQIALIILLLLISVTQLKAELSYQNAIKHEVDFDWKQAIKGYEQALRWSPFGADYAEGLGGVLWKTMAISLSEQDRAKNRDEAIKAYERAVRNNRFRSRNYFALAQLYDASSREDDARKALANAIHYEPSNGKYISEAAYFALKYQNYERALVLFADYLSLGFKGIDSTDPCIVIRDLVAVVDDNARLREIMPNKFKLSHCFAENLAAKGDWDEAVKQYKKAVLEAKKHYGLERYFRAYARHAADKLEAAGYGPIALSIYEKAASDNPHDKDLAKDLLVLKRKYNLE